MKLARYNGGRLGLVENDRIIDLTQLLDIDTAEWPPVGINRVIRDFPELRDRIEKAKSGLDSVPLDGVTFDTPIPWPHKLIAIPVNYHAHALEMSSPAISKNGGFFMKSSASLIGASAPVELPDLPGRSIHHEAELAVIIGRGGRFIKKEDALDHVFGYACLLDMTVRGKQERTIRKSYDSFTPVGPWITLADEVGDPADLDVRLWVNDELRQDANTRDMILSVVETIEMVSAVTTLEPGDVIATGTAEGVGPVSPGDKITIDITRVGRMSVDVKAGTGGGNIAIPHILEGEVAK